MTQNSLRLSKIGFFSPLAGVGTDCGYGYAAVELITSWQRQGVPVWTSDSDAPVIFNFGQPHFYERVEGKLNIGYTPWESNMVPKSWVRSMNRMDEVWATCEENAKWYRDAGVKVPVRVLHHGVNRSHYPIRKRRITEGEPFRFLHIGEPTPRKGGEVAYRVFRSTFGDSSRVHLTLKGKPHFKVVGSNVSVIEDRLDQEGMTKLYLDHHSLIYPTNGEGFGFIPFNGAATGMPTAVTNWSAPVDYMRYCFPITVEDMVVPDYEPHVGQWAKPDEENLAMWMNYFVKSPNYYFTKAHRLATTMDAKWSWDAIGKRALEMMTDSLNRLPA